MTQNERRHGVVTRLRTQLDVGTKTKKGTVDVKIPLTETDKKRIHKEIDILKTKMS